jgi:hypothetical protein
LAALSISAGSSQAATVFVDDFEGEGNTDDSTISTYDKYPPVPSGWVSATEGFGADSAGLNLVGTNTLYSFRYTNSGLTTDNGVIGALVSNTTYTVTFQVAQDDGGAAPYSVSLVTFNGAARNDVRTNTGATSTLASLNGDASSSSLETVSLSYTADGTESTLGHDVAIRIFGASTSANYDNFSVSAIPEPTSALVGGLCLLGLLRRRR